MYIVTGILRDGRRFRLQYANRVQALGINLWCGNVWEVDECGKRKRIKSVVN